MRDLGSRTRRRQRGSTGIGEEIQDSARTFPLLHLAGQPFPVHSLFGKDADVSVRIARKLEVDIAPPDDPRFIERLELLPIGGAPESVALEAGICGGPPLCVAARAARHGSRAIEKDRTKPFQLSPLAEIEQFVLIRLPHSVNVPDLRHLPQAQGLGCSFQPTARALSQLELAILGPTPTQRMRTDLGIDG